MLDDIDEIPEGGALLYQGSRYMLLPPAALVDFQKSMEDKLGTEAVSQALYSSALRQGRYFTGKVLDELSLEPDDAVRYMAALARGMGWGRIEITSLDISSLTLELEAFHSAFAEEYGKAKDPVCSFIRGFFAGVWQAVTGSEVEGLEMHCRAVEGPSPCIFVFAGSADRKKLRVSISQVKVEED